MKTFWFEIILQSQPFAFDDFADASFEAGCDDGTPSIIDDVVTVSFAREAETLDQAVSSAVKQLELIGCKISRIEIANLESIREMA